MPKQHLLEIATIVCGTGAIGPVLARQLFKTIRHLLSQREQNKHLTGLRKITQIYEELNQILASDTDISRVMIIRSSNSGGIPQPGCRIFIRVLHESFRTLHDSVVHNTRWQERQADQHYIHLVRELAEQGTLCKSPQELPEDSTLRAIWDAARIKRGCLYRLKLSGTEMVYLAVHYREDEEPSAVSRAVLATSVDQLRQLFS